MIKVIKNEYEIYTIKHYEDIITDTGATVNGLVKTERALIIEIDGKMIVFAIQDIQVDKPVLEEIKTQISAIK